MNHKINNRISYTETVDSLTFVILSGLKPIIRYVYTISSVCFIGVSLFFLYDMLMYESIISGVFFLLVTCACIVILKTVSRKEIIHVDRMTILITRKDFIETKSFSYAIADISHLRYAGENDFTPHVLNVGDFDYLGLQTSEKEVQQIIKDGTLEFFYKGGRVRFGMDVFSWDAEEILSRIENFTGNNLQIDDAMEQELKENNIESDDL